MKIESLAQLQPPATKPPTFQLKKLAPKHKQIAALLAQGAPRQDIAQILKVTPEYVSMLSKDPLMVAYMQEMSEFANVRMEAMFEKTANIISEVMDSGSHKDKLAAARLQLEATKRLGKQEQVVKHEHSLVAILSRLPTDGPYVPIRDTSGDDKVVSDQ